MRTANQVLTQYAAYHRDRRNIATHFVGVPIIVFSVVLALAQVVIGPVHLGWIGIILATIYY
ncbi:MAG: Mpo1-like protein, partial [Usitatibacteraceae bacterium]